MFIRKYKKANKKKRTEKNLKNYNYFIYSILDSKFNILFMGKLRQYRSNQGRNPIKEKTTIDIILSALVGIIVFSIIIFFKK